MKTNYFNKIENKYVFNLSLIFWHLFIILSSVAIVIGVLVFLWSVIPPAKQKIVKPSYPEKQEYPSPVAVSIAEVLNEKQIDFTASTSSRSTNLPVTARSTPQSTESNEGKQTYDSSLAVLKTLIPPTKYSWSSSGYWSYPYGQRYWDVYKDEVYRQWNVTELSVEDKLYNSYNISNAHNYVDRKKLLDSYISILQALTEEKRYEALNILTNYVSSSLSLNLNINRTLASVAGKMKNEHNLFYMSKIIRFCTNYQSEGTHAVEYIAAILDKFDEEQRLVFINHFLNSYSSYFNESISKQKEATDMFIPMLSEIKKDEQSKALLRYYDLYVFKNQERENIIAQIESDYNQKVQNIENQFIQEQLEAEAEYNSKKIIKSGLRSKSLAGIGGGIVMIVGIGILLVFLSIQRSVRKIEEKVSGNN